MNTLRLTAATRAQHKRDSLRFASDLTDAEWTVLEPLLPPVSGGGRPPKWPFRDIVDGIFYVLRGGIAWRMLPPCFPPRQTVYGWFAAWREAGVWEAINHRLVMPDRERAGRQASPSAAVVDSQSVKSTEAGGLGGFDAGKKVKGRERHAIVDTDGRLLKVQISAASVQDRADAVPLLRASRGRFPFVERAFADSAYAADRVARATCIAVEIVRKPPVARSDSRYTSADGSWEGASLGWAETDGWQRISKPQSPSATAFIYAASAMLLIRRMARCT